jgi:hypothetical protein
MKIILSVVGLAITCLLSPPSLLNATPQKNQEQTVFGTEDSEVMNPVPTPPEVIRILSQDQEVSRELRSHHLPQGEIPSSWLTTSKVQLFSPQEVDYIVIARSFLAGANLTTFWIFRSTQHGLDLVLTVPAQTLRIKPTQTHGGRAIEVAALIGGRAVFLTYTFNGTNYTNSKQVTRSSSPKNSSEP